MISGKDIIIVGLQPWDTEIGSNCKNIALEFSKHNRVLYVNSPLDRITLIRKKHDLAIRKRIDILRGKSDNLEQVQDNLWVYYPDSIIESINWIKIYFLFDVLNKYNNRIFSSSILRAVKRLNFQQFILFNDNDIFRSFYLKDYLKPLVSVYYSRDYLLGVDYWKHHGERLEPKLMRRSDVCVANSTYLADLCRRFNPHSYYVGQGCEVDIFLNADQYPIPEDINAIPKPIVGYIGVLQTLRLDIQIIEYLARARPNWSIVLIGPEGEEFKNSRLHSINNIHFLGSKQPAQLPAYVKSFTVCINPQIVNEVTIGNYPRKIDEYLAVGKPVVATRTKAMDVFAEYCFLANTKEEYVQLIEYAIKNDDENWYSRRRAFAASHTWEHSVDEIYKSILNVKQL